MRSRGLQTYAIAVGTRTSHFLQRRSACAILAFGLLCLPAAPAMAQSGPAASASSTADTRALILRRLSFVKVQDLEFGDIVPPATGPSTVRLHPDGSRTTTGGATVVGSNQQPARFAGQGSYNQQVAVSMGANNIWLTGPTGSTAMRVRNFEIGSTPTAILSTTPTRFRISSTSGIFNFPLGAILDINSGQMAGDYSGTFTITLNYL